jgi:hypothetical protein
MRRFFLILILGAGVPLAGCETMNRRAMSDSERSEYYNPRDYHDEFDGVGQEGRGHQAMEHESDWLSRFVESPKARAINRNLGYD